MIDPGQFVVPGYYYEPGVPLTLAPLFALSTGVEPDEVLLAAEEFIERLAEARRSADAHSSKRRRGARLVGG